MDDDRPFGIVLSRVRQTQILVIFLISLISAISACSKTQPKNDEAREIRVGYMPYTSDLAIFVAMEKGYFAEEGVSPKLTMFRSTTDNVNALATGRIDATGIIGSPTLFARECEAEGLFRMFLPAVETESRYSASFLVPKDSTLETISDLKGHTVGTYTGTTQALNLAYILGKFMDPDEDVTVAQVSSELQLSALASGQFDALLTIEPHVTIGCSQGIARLLEANPRCKYIMSPFPASAQAVSTDFLARNVETFRRYYRALRKAVEFIDAHPNEAKRFLPKYTDLEAKVAEDSNMYQWQLDEDVDRGKFQQLADLYHSKGILSRKISAEGLFVPIDTLGSAD